MRLTLHCLTLLFPRYTVEEANQLAPAFAKIYKEMIIVAAPTKPLPRPAKGTLARKQAVKEFEPEIEAL